MVDAEGGSEATEPSRGLAQRGFDSVDVYLRYVAMKTAKLFQHGGSQAVRLPRMFRFEGTEEVIERRGEEVILRSSQGAVLWTGNVGEFSRVRGLRCAAWT